MSRACVAYDVQLLLPVQIRLIRQLRCDQVSYLYDVACVDARIGIVACVQSHQETWDSVYSIDEANLPLKPYYSLHRV